MIKLILGVISGKPVIAAAVAGAVVLAGALYMKGRSDAAHSAEVAHLERSLAGYERALAEDQKRAAQASMKARLLEQKVKEIESSIPDGACFDGATSDRVRSLWED